MEKGVRIKEGGNERKAGGDEVNEGCPRAEASSPCLSFPRPPPLGLSRHALLRLLSPTGRLLHGFPAPRQTRQATPLRRMSTRAPPRRPLPSPSRARGWPTTRPSRASESPRRRGRGARPVAGRLRPERRRGRAEGASRMRRQSRRGGRLSRGAARRGLGRVGRGLRAASRRTTHAPQRAARPTPRRWRRRRARPLRYVRLHVRLSVRGGGGGGGGGGASRPWDAARLRTATYKRTHAPTHAPTSPRTPPRARSPREISGRCWRWAPRLCSRWARWCASSLTRAGTC